MRALVIFRQLAPLVLSFLRDRKRWLFFGAPTTRTPAFHQARAEQLVSAIAEHPLGRAADISLRFTLRADGRYHAITPLPQGRWLVHWLIRADGQEMRFLERQG